MMFESLLLLFSLAVSTSVRDIDYRFTGSMATETTNTDSIMITLPVGLKKELAEFKGFRLPEAADYKLDWREFYDIDPTPFITWGDFNHDGKQDIVTYLIGKRDDMWALVVFNKTDVGFEPHVLYPPTKPPKEKTYKIEHGSVQRHGVIAKTECSNGKPCPESYLYESAGNEWIWEDGKYKRVNTSD